jgi:hypothetical protein
MRNTQENLRKEETAGTLPTGTAELYGASVQSLERDRVLFERLIASNLAEVAQGVALPPLSGISGVAPVEVPDLLKMPSVRAEDFAADAQARSLELQTLEALLAASRELTHEVSFGFLDPEGSGSIGFGTASTIRVSRSRENEIQIRIAQMKSLIDQRCVQAATEYNSALESFRVASTGRAASYRRLDWLIQRHRQGDGTMGEAEFSEQLGATQSQILGFVADQASSVLGWQIAKSRIDRLTLQGYYQSLTDALPTEQKGTPQ